MFMQQLCYTVCNSELELTNEEIYISYILGQPNMPNPELEQNCLHV